MKNKMKCTLKLLALMLIFVKYWRLYCKAKAHKKQAQTVTTSSSKEERSDQQNGSLISKKHEQERIL